MSLSFEKNPLLLGLSGGALISSAIVSMNTLPGKSTQKLIGMPLFVSGWILIILSFIRNTTRNDKFKPFLVSSSIVVMMAAMVARMMMESNYSGSGMKVTMGVFMLSWIVIGLMIGMKEHPVDNVHKDADGQFNLEITHEDVHDKTIHLIGLAPPVLVLMSMMLVNGIERPNNMASGPGMPMFLSSWVILSLVNSVKV